jgi:hypothetical protein
VALSRAALTEVAVALHQARQAEAGRLDPIHDAMRGVISGIYVPRKATQEYRNLVDQARFNVLPLVVSQLAQALFVDGYRASGAAENSPIWDEVWQPNRMDARQSGLYRAAIQYGTAYARVLPGTPAPQITPLSPRRCTALYDDPMVDEWPQYALVHRQGDRYVVYDDEQAYPVRMGASGPVLDGAALAHGLGVCPIVRFASGADLDGAAAGKVEPLLPVQRQLNQTTYSLLMAQQYAAFRQRWVTGMTIEEDADGNPREPFDVGVDRMLHAEDPDAKFGDFAQSDLSGYLESRDKALLYISSVAQIPPHNLIVGSGISNISAEALAALEAGHRQDIAEHQTNFGESIEQVLRLAGLAMADMATWADTSAQVVWRDTTPRSIGQVADALGKMSQMLDVPPRALWERIPGVTQQDLARWAALADERDDLAMLEGLLADGPGTAPPGPVDVAAESPAGMG